MHCLFLAFQEFTDLLEKQVSIEEYTEWIASLVTRCVVKVNN